MRALVVALVIGSVGLASADPLPESAFDWRRPNDSGVFVEVASGLRHAERDGVTYSADFVRFAPHVNAGIMVGGDISSRHDLMAGLQLGFHFEPYDAMNR